VEDAWAGRLIALLLVVLWGFRSVCRKPPSSQSALPLGSGLGAAGGGVRQDRRSFGGLHSRPPRLDLGECWMGLSGQSGDSGGDLSETVADRPRSAVTASGS
jgi:hypothetical protein